MDFPNAKFHGWIGIHKPLGITSFDVVRDVRRLLPRKTKVGHGGTLDPQASGVLPIAIGEATKTVDYLMDERKTYVFDVKWGMQTQSDDAESLDSDAILYASDMRPTQEDVACILDDFIGDLEQMPPQYSAKKIDGKRACDRMRDGEDVILKPSKITVYSLKILDHDPQQTKFEAVCSKGTYVRSLARDMGQKIGCYGYAASILRTRVGNMSLERCQDVKSLANSGETCVLSQHVQPIQAVLADIPAVLVTPDQETKLRYGQVVVDLAMDHVSESHILCVSEDDRAIAIVEASQTEHGVPGYKPKRVFNIFK